MHNAHVLVFALTVALIATGCQSNKQSGEITELPEIKEAPEFAFMNYDGTMLTEQDLAGDIYIASFFFTSCGGPCPIMNSTANVLQAEFADVPQFRIVSFTVDPETDTLERLTKYAARYNAQPGRWYFLRNSKDAVADLSSNGFMMGDASQPALHSTRFALVDANGMIRGYFDGTDEKNVDELRAAIRFLVEEHV